MIGRLNHGIAWADDSQRPIIATRQRNRLSVAAYDRLPYVHYARANHGDCTYRVAEQ